MVMTSLKVREQAWAMQCLTAGAYRGEGGAWLYRGREEC